MAFLSKLCELLQQVLFPEELLHALRRAQRRKLSTVLVRIGKGKLADETGEYGLAVIGCDTRCVFWNEDVGHDASTAINDTSDARLILFALLVDTILREELAPLIACNQVVLVLLIMPFLVGLLDASTAGRIVSGNCKTNHAAVTELHRLLYEAFTKGATTHDCAAVVVLNCSGEYLAGTGAAFIHKHHDG